jgi:hypothetical protein
LVVAFIEASKVDKEMVNLKGNLYSIDKKYSPTTNPTNSVGNTKTTERGGGG